MIVIIRILVMTLVLLASSSAPEKREPAPGQDDSRRIAANVTWLKEQTGRLSALTAVDAQEARLAALKARVAGESCKPTDNEQLIAEVAIWAVGQQQEIAADFDRGKPAVDACDPVEVGSALQCLKETRDQLA